MLIRTQEDQEPQSTDMCLNMPQVVGVRVGRELDPSEFKLRVSMCRNHLCSCIHLKGVSFWYLDDEATFPLSRGCVWVQVILNKHTCGHIGVCAYKCICV